jgi:hypothetical protein
MTTLKQSFRSVLGGVAQMVPNSRLPARSGVCMVVGIAFDTATMDMDGETDAENWVPLHSSP